jgi:hypothetical protein
MVMEIIGGGFHDKDESRKKARRGDNEKMQGMFE